MPTRRMCCLLGRLAEGEQCVRCRQFDYIRELRDGSRRQGSKNGGAGDEHEKTMSLSMYVRSTVHRTRGRRRSAAQRCCSVEEVGPEKGQNDASRVLGVRRTQYGLLGVVFWQGSGSYTGQCARPKRTRIARVQGASSTPARYLVVTSIDPVSFLLGSLIS